MENNLQNTGIAWIPFLPSDWKTSKVKWLFSLSKEKAKQKDPTILSLARSGVHERDISNNEGQLAESYFDYNPVIPNDLLLNTMDLYSGANCSISEISGVISPAYANLRAKEDINPRYYDFFFKSQYWGMAMFAHGKGVSFDNRWTLNSEGLLNYEVPLPSRKEQNSIVNFINRKISSIDSLIDNENQQIEMIREYKQSLISRTVLNGISKEPLRPCGLDWLRKLPESWKEIRLKDYFSFGKGLPITKADLVSEGVKVISYGQIHAKYNMSTRIDERMYRFVPSSFIKTNEECLVQKDDFLVADTSEDLQGTGDFVRVSNDDTIFAGYHCIILKAKKRSNSHFLSYLFLTDAWRNQFRSKVSGVKLFSLTQRILNQGTIILPLEDEQEKICSFLDKKCLCFDRLIEIKQKKITLLSEYRKSVIYEYSIGKRRVS